MTHLSGFVHDQIATQRKYTTPRHIQDGVQAAQWRMKQQQPSGQRLSLEHSRHGFVIYPKATRHTAAPLGVNWRASPTPAARTPAALLRLP